MCEGEPRSGLCFYVYDPSCSASGVYLTLKTCDKVAILHHQSREMLGLSINYVSRRAIRSDKRGFCFADVDITAYRIRVALNRLEKVALLHQHKEMFGLRAEESQGVINMVLILYTSHIVLVRCI